MPFRPSNTVDTLQLLFIANGKSKTRFHAEGLGLEGRIMAVFDNHITRPSSFLQKHISSFHVTHCPYIRRLVHFLSFSDMALLCFIRTRKMRLQCLVGSCLNIMNHLHISSVVLLLFFPSSEVLVVIISDYISSLDGITHKFITPKKLCRALNPAFLSLHQSTRWTAI